VQFKNADADRLMDEAVRETDQAKRAELYKQLQVILAEELPWAPLFNYLDRFAYTNRLQGYRPNPYLSTNFDNAAEWKMAAD
jgi:peptide/nickel transport system substrate-binding protein